MSYFDALEQSSSKKEKLRDSDYEQLDQVMVLITKKSKCPNWWCFYKRESITICKEIGLQWIPSFSFRSLYIFIFVIYKNINIKVKNIYIWKVYFIILSVFVIYSIAFGFIYLFLFQGTCKILDFFRYLEHSVTRTFFPGPIKIGHSGCRL